MVAHDHTEYIDGCFRCELSRDEVAPNLYEVLKAVEAVYEDAQNGALEIDDPSLVRLFKVAGISEATEEELPTF